MLWLLFGSGGLCRWSCRLLLLPLSRPCPSLVFVLGLLAPAMRPVLVLRVLVVGLSLSPSLCGFFQRHISVRLPALQVHLWVGNLTSAFQHVPVLRLAHVLLALGAAAPSRSAVYLSLASCTRALFRAPLRPSSVPSGASGVIPGFWRLYPPHFSFLKCGPVVVPLCARSPSLLPPCVVCASHAISLSCFAISFFCLLRGFSLSLLSWIWPVSCAHCPVTLLPA